MDNEFSFRATLKTDDELHYCIDNREKYLPESVEAAVTELQKRGTNFSEEELKVIEEDMQAKREIISSAKVTYGIFNRNDKIYQVDDKDAPFYYSKQAIVAFSVLFSVLFGSVMLAVNVNKAQSMGKAILVVLYGLVFTVVTVILAIRFNIGTYFSLVIGLLGAYSMEFLFWKNYLGNGTLYRAKPIWIPLIIALAIFIPLLFLIFTYGTP